jgi:hypothetical protein
MVVSLGVVVVVPITVPPKLVALVEVVAGVVYIAGSPSSPSTMVKYGNLCISASSAQRSNAKSDAATSFVYVLQSKDTWKVFSLSWISEYPSPTEFLG